MKKNKDYFDLIYFKKIYPERWSVKFVWFKKLGEIWAEKPEKAQLKQNKLIQKKEQQPKEKQRNKLTNQQKIQVRF